jgi:hypothetical protein
MRIVRGAKREDADAIWRILEPMVRAGETYPLPWEMSKDEALAYWMGADHEVFVAELQLALAALQELEARDQAFCVNGRCDSSVPNTRLLSPNGVIRK